MPRSIEASGTNAELHGDVQTVLLRGLLVVPIVMSPIGGQKSDREGTAPHPLGHRDGARGPDGEGQGGRALSVALVERTSLCLTGGVLGALGGLARSPSERGAPNAGGTGRLPQRSDRAGRSLVCARDVVFIVVGNVTLLPPGTGGAPNAGHGRHRPWRRGLPAFAGGLPPSRIRFGATGRRDRSAGQLVPPGWGSVWRG